MEGRSKSRFPEKCKSCIWGRFPSQFWPHFGAMLAPKMHFFSKKQLLEINQKKRYPPSLKQVREPPTAKPDGSRKAAPRARAFSNKKQLFEQLLGIVLDLLRKNRSRCKKSEKVAEKFKSSVQLVRVPTKLIKTCWKRCSNSWNIFYYTVLVIWHALGKGPANFNGNRGFGAPPARSSVWCSPAGGFFFWEKQHF